MQMRKQVFEKKIQTLTTPLEPNPPWFSITLKSNPEHEIPWLLKRYDQQKLDGQIITLVNNKQPVFQDDTPCSTFDSSTLSYPNPLI